MEQLPLETDELTLEAAMARAPVLAEQHGLSVYDAMYLELALRCGLPLATLDRQLSKSCIESGVQRCL